MSENKLEYNDYAKKWVEALPLGNGKLGAMVYGNPYEDMISLNHETLWSGAPIDYHNHEASKYLEEVRALMAKGEVKKAQNIVEAKMVGRFTESFLPMCDILIKNNVQIDIIDYNRELDLNKAVHSYICKADTTNGCVSFISSIDDVLVYKIEGSNLDITINISSQLKHEVKNKNNRLILNGQAPYHVEPHYMYAKNPVHYTDNLSKQGMKFGTYIDVITDSGHVYCDKNGMRIKETDMIILLIAAETSFSQYDKNPFTEGKDYEALLQNRLSLARRKGYDQLLVDHLSEYQPLYSRASLKFDIDKVNETIAKLYNYGRYLLLSCSRNCNEPANLQGIWNKELVPYWSCNYTTNINLQMNYWMANVCDLDECVKPLVKFIEELSVDGKKTSRIHYDCDGWTAHHNSGLWRMAVPAGTDYPMENFASAFFWPMAGSWLCLHLWEQYQYTNDQQFLEHTAHPLIEGAVKFLLDWMVEDEIGYLTTSPSTSPENSYFNKEGIRIGIDTGSTMDMSIILELLQIYLEIAKISDIYCPLREQALDAITKIRPFRLESNGQIMEWSEEKIPFEKYHRHHSPLYGLYPGTLINATVMPRIFEGCKTFLDNKMQYESCHYGWGVSWSILLYARMADSIQVEKLVKEYSHESIYPNLFSSHKPLSEKEDEVFQIDASLGFTAGIAETLIQSHEGYIDLLPALPKSWGSGSVAGLKARGNYKVDIKWKDGLLSEARMEGEKGQTCFIKYKGKVIEYRFEEKSYIWINSKLEIVDRGETR